MSLEEAINSLKEAVTKPGIIIQTPDYIYAIYEVAPGTWKQVSITLPDKSVDITTVDVRRALLYLIEEVSKSLPNYAGKWKTIMSVAEVEELADQLKG